MNSDLMPSIVQMDEAIFKNLVAEVKETIATGITMIEEPKQSFGVADLWNIRKTAKSASTMVRRY